MATLANTSTVSNGTAPYVPSTAEGTTSNNLLHSSSKVFRSTASLISDTTEGTTTSNAAHPSSTLSNSTASFVSNTVVPVTTAPVMYPPCTKVHTFDVVREFHINGGRLAETCISIFYGLNIDHADIVDVVCKCFRLLPENVANINCSCQIASQTSVIQLWHKCSTLEDIGNRKRWWLMHLSVFLKIRVFLHLESELWITYATIHHTNAGRLVKECPANNTASESLSLQTLAALPSSKLADALVCCSDAGERTSYFTKYDAHYTGSECIFLKGKKYTYYAAATVCFKLRKRLCTQTELLSSKADCAPGCSVDHGLVWTSSIAPRLNSTMPGQFFTRLDWLWIIYVFVCDY